MALLPFGLRVNLGLSRVVYFSQTAASVEEASTSNVVMHSHQTCSYKETLK